MFNFFKTNTVDTIVFGLTKILNKLEQVEREHIYAAEDAEEEIEELKKVRDNNLAEAARAAKITNNVKKLLDIK